MEARTQADLLGFDASHWNGTIDFAKARADGYVWTMLKATDGTNYVDPNFKTYVAGARAHGLLVGFYHFARFASVADALAEAQFFVDTVKEFDADLPLALDLEVDSYTLNPDTMSQCAEAFMDYVNANHKHGAVLYTFANFIKTQITSALTKYPLWYASYGHDQPDDNVWTSWAMLQFTSTGTVDGVQSAHVDLDVISEAYAKALHLVVPADPSVKPAPKPKPVSKPLPKPPTPPKPSFKIENYAIQDGDTFWGLSVHLHVPVALIQKLNPKVDPTKLRIGQVIKIPVASGKSAPSKPKFKTHVIAKGDTLWDLAQANGTTVAELEHLNPHVDPRSLHIGDKITIPA